MDSNKVLVAASAAVTLLGAAGAHAATVGTATAALASATTIQSTSGPITVERASGTGSGVLDSSGTFTLMVTGAVGYLLPPTISPEQTLTINETDVFSGTIAGNTFTATSGTTNVTKCTGSTDCPAPGASTFSKAGGTVSLLSGGGGTLTGTSHPDGGVATSADVWTITKFTPTTVPLPPAVWLLGSGLLGLVGTARRRLKS